MGACAQMKPFLQALSNINFDSRKRISGVLIRRDDGIRKELLV